MPKPSFCILFWLFAEFSIASRQNIVLFIADDLDFTLGGMIPLLKTRKWLEDKVSVTNTFLPSFSFFKFFFDHFNAVKAALKNSFQSNGISLFYFFSIKI